MSATTKAEAVSALTGAFSSGSYILDESGRDWVETWWEGKARNTTDRVTLLALDDASGALRQLCDSVRKEKRWIDALAELQQVVAGEAAAISDPDPVRAVVSAAVLDAFEGAMSLEGTRFCS